MNPGGTEKTWNIVAFCALIVLAAIAMYDLVVPKPAEAKTKQQRTFDVNMQMHNVEIHKSDLAKAQAASARYIWSVKKTDEIGASSLKTITAMAQKHKVTVLGFRPQKATSDSGLQVLPYLIILEGDFPGMSAFLNDLENVQTKLAVTMVQLASADANTDRVNANIGVTAYSLPLPQSGSSVREGVGGRETPLSFRAKSRDLGPSHPLKRSVQ